MKEQNNIKITKDELIKIGFKKYFGGFRIKISDDIHGAYISIQLNTINGVNVTIGEGIYWFKGSKKFKCIKDVKDLYNSLTGKKI